MGRGLVVKAGMQGDICKSSVAVVVQEGIGNPALVAKPGTAHQQHIRKTVIVIVGVGQVEPARHACQAGFVRHFDITAMAVIPEIA